MVVASRTRASRVPAGRNRADLNELRLRRHAHEATAGDSCAAAASLDPSIRIRAMFFMDRDGNRIPFSDFSFDPALSRSFGEHAGRFQAYTATALTDIPRTVAELHIEFRIQGPDPSDTAVASRFSTARIAAGQMGNGGFVDHFAIINPVAVVDCLGPVDPTTGLTTCPAPPQPVPGTP